jgi:hypothetical protein
MTAAQRLDRDLPLILGDLAIGPYPDYIDDVLATTAQRRQRPAWTFPERWLPMDIAARPVPTPAFPWRQVGVLALIASLLAVALAAYIARSRLPEPFGRPPIAPSPTPSRAVSTQPMATSVVAARHRSMIDTRPQFSATARCSCSGGI